MAEDLAELERWLGRIADGLTPARRKAMAGKIGQALRRANLARIADNVEPDGAPMTPRKPRRDRRGRLRRRQGGKMFKGLRHARNWKIDADADGVEIHPASNAVDRVASVSQFGETAVVGYLRSGTPIRARYAQRRLLGDGEDDRLLVLATVGDLLDPDAS